MNLIEHNQAQLAFIQTILNQVSQDHYRTIQPWPGQPSIGKHVRHVLDHYTQLQAAYACGALDYRQRSRETHIQEQPLAAAARVSGHIQWLGSLNECQLHRQLRYTCDGADTHTTLLRELDFVASHATHHLTAIHTIMHPLGYAWPTDAGVHPATLSHLAELADTTAKPAPCLP